MARVPIAQNNEHPQDDFVISNFGQIQQLCNLLAELFTFFFLVAQQIGKTNERSREDFCEWQREGVPPAKPPRYWRQLRDAYSDPGLQLLNLALPVILTCMISPPLNAPGTLEVQEGAALPTMQFIPTGAPGPAELAGLNFKTLKLYEVPAGGEPVRTTVNVAMEQAWGIS